ncbi:MAG TPA: phosphocarrier protein HPr [Oribacterium sp.]|jgi:phosphotransferase system HPr-like phosphotransfer protein|nr:phosphocarrier protein HPr [Oribacterium sp.]
MGTFNVLINKEDIGEFVRTTSRLPFDMDLSLGTKVVDAKSLIGILYLGVGKVLSLKTAAENVACAQEFLEKFVVA